MSLCVHGYNSTLCRQCGPGRPGVGIPATDEHRAKVLCECIAVFRRWLHLPDPGHVLVMLAAVAANRTTGDPVWVLFVGSPGSGKTEALGPLASLQDCHPAATLAEAALLSGTPTRDNATGAKGGLLRRIGDFGIIVLKDFTSILAMNRDTRAVVLAALREVYDGSWTRHVGTDGGRTLHWSGKVGLLAGCTGTIDSHHAVMASMGERMVLYRLPEVDGAEQVAAALDRGDDEPVMRAELTEAVRAVLALASAEVSKLDDAERIRLTALAALAARARSAVERDGYTREITLIPASEAPARIALVLRRLLDGLTGIGTPREIAWHLIAKLALDCLPDVRRKVLVDVVTLGATTTKALGERLGYPTTTARRNLEDLAAHGLVTRQSVKGGADLFTVSEWTAARWTEARFPETSDPAKLFYFLLLNERDKTGKLQDGKPDPGEIKVGADACDASDASGEASDASADPYLTLAASPAPVPRWCCVACSGALDPVDLAAGQYAHAMCNTYAEVSA